MVYGCVKSKLDGTEHVYGSNVPMSLPKKYSYIKQLPKILDQGDDPMCVPCSISCCLNWMVNVQNGEVKVDNHIDVREIYERSDTKCNEGMELKDALRALRKVGVDSDKGKLKIERYAMVGTKEHLKQALIANGPCVGALPVYNEKKERFWHDDGSPYKGGHAIAIVGYDANGFIIRNSWGTSYGDKGYGVISYDDMENFYEIWTMW